MSERTKCLLNGFIGTCVAIAVYLALNSIGDFVHDYVATKWCVRQAQTVEVARACTYQSRQ